MTDEKECVKVNVDAFDLLIETIQHFPFFKKQHKGHQFLTYDDIVEFFVKLIYQNDIVLVLYNCKTAFLTVPKLTIKKRDDFSTYMLGISNDIAVIEFGNVKIAEDWAFSLPVDASIRYTIYRRGIAYRNEKGIIDNGKGKKF